jgi:hypothetical protein
MDGWIERQKSGFQARAGIWSRCGWLPASPMYKTNLRQEFLFLPSRIQGFAKQATLTWKESDSSLQENWNESGRQDWMWGPHPGAWASPSRKSMNRPQCSLGERAILLKCTPGLPMHHTRITTTLLPTFQTCQGARSCHTKSLKPESSRPRFQLCLKSLPC